MNTSLIIARKEFRAAFRNRLFLTITLLFLGLSILSVYIGSTTKRAEMRIYNETVASLQAEGAAVIPTAPEIHTLTILSNLTEYVAIVGAILAVILGYNALIEEKESGGLKLILSRPVYRDQLLIGKLLGNTAVIATLLALVFIFNLVLLVIIGGIWPTVGEAARLLTFTVIALAYMLIFLTVSMFLSIRLNNGATVFLISLTLWVLVSFVVPQMADAMMTNSSVVNSINGAINQIPQDTAVSQAINYLSPTWHLRNIGGQLLQFAPGSGVISAGTLVGHTLATLLVLLAPTAAFIAAGFNVFQRNETLVLES
ncbi:MAG: ABC transporter permease subunit [Ardenticatenaceae bacterium]|nr:ABC transporter permease subunit [Ardenticatenaceae bacterium]MCB8989835.1 ABC transporter permease subunit [Ardenticatenaceae bacterium]